MSSPNEKNEKRVDYEVVKKLAKRINRLNDKIHQVAIINIIKTMNPDIAITENENGILIKFNSLTQETYSKISNYLHKNVQKKTDEESDIPTTSEYVPYSPDDAATPYDKYKLSNREKTLIKKQKYSQIIEN